MMNKNVDQLYEEREKRYIQAVDLEQPDRVPHETRFGEYWALITRAILSRGAR